MNDLYKCCGCDEKIPLNQEFKMDGLYYHNECAYYGQDDTSELQASMDRINNGYKA